MYPVYHWSNHRNFTCKCNYENHTLKMLFMQISHSPLNANWCLYWNVQHAKCEIQAIKSHLLGHQNISKLFSWIPFDIILNTMSTDTVWNNEVQRYVISHASITIHNTCSFLSSLSFVTFHSMWFTFIEWNLKFDEWNLEFDALLNETTFFAFFCCVKTEEWRDSEWMYE